MSILDDLREMEASGEVTPDEVQDAFLQALRAQSWGTLQFFAAQFDALDRPESARICRSIAATKKTVH